MKTYGLIPNDIRAPVVIIHYVNNSIIVLIALKIEFYFRYLCP